MRPSSWLRFRCRIAQTPKRVCEVRSWRCRIARYYTHVNCLFRAKVTTTTDSLQRHDHRCRLLIRCLPWIEDEMRRQSISPCFQVLLKSSQTSCYHFRWLGTGVHVGHDALLRQERIQRGWLPANHDILFDSPQPHRDRAGLPKWSHCVP